MTTAEESYIPREYQIKMLDRIEDLQGKANPILELDCGLGKRFITHQLVTKRFPKLRFVVVTNSTGSHAQTVDYFRKVYGDTEDEVGDLRRAPYYLRKQILEEKRIIITTAQVLANVLSKHRSLISGLDALIINEVDTIVRKLGDERNLVRPWNTLLLRDFKDKWIIGMTGTLWDEHVIQSGTRIQKQKDIDTLLKQIPRSTVLLMEDFMDSDIQEYVEPTQIEIVHVEGGLIKTVLVIIELMISDLRPRIKGFVPDATTSTMHLDNRIPSNIRRRYSWLLFLRKFVYARPPRNYLKYLNNRFFKEHLNYNVLRRKISKTSPKVGEAVQIALDSYKSVILCSYLDMVGDIEEGFFGTGIEVFKITGQVSDKGEVLRDFRNIESKAVLIMSPVGERDLDIPEADMMVVCDAINTSKTMYQRIKRTRGGRVVFLAYEGTSEVRKIELLIERIMKNYPWSIEYLGLRKIPSQV
jgi:ERCC4-related helicase